MFLSATRLSVLVLGLTAPAYTYAANFCIAVNGGFGNGGTSYIGPNFKLPAGNHCAPWAGFTKTASTVIAFANGSGCLSGNGKVLTLTFFNTDPQFFGPGASASDQIQLCPTGVTGCSISGQDTGYFNGPAAEQSCTGSLLTLPQTHD